MSKQNAKVSGILELISKGDCKQAVKRCNTYIAATDSFKFYALKALALQKMKHSREAKELIYQIRSEVVEDLEDIEIVVIVFKNLKDYQEVANIYEEAYQKYPNEERGQLLLNSYIATFQLGDQARLGIRLHRHYSKMHYAETAAFCMVVLSDLEKSQTGLLDVADLLFQKFKQMEDFEPSQTFLNLDLAILERLHKYQEAMALIRKHETIIPDYVSRSSSIAKFYRLRGEYISCLNNYHSILALNLNEQTSRDMWHIYTDYIDTVFILVRDACQGPTRFNQQCAVEPTNVNISVIDTGKKFGLWKSFTGGESLTSILMSALTNLKFTRDSLNGTSAICNLIKRQSYLAEMEFKRRLVYYNFNQGKEEYKDENEPGGLFFNLIVKYVAIFYEVPNTPDELIPYLYLINNTQLQGFKARLEAVFEKVQSMTTNRVRCLKCYLCVHKIFRLVGLYSSKFFRSVEEMWDAAYSLVSSYLEYIGAEIPPRKGENYISDELVLLAVEVLLQSPPSSQLDTETQSEDQIPSQFEIENYKAYSQRILFCIGLLEFALEKSPHNNYFKQKLLELYYTSSNYLGAHRIFEKLEIKPENVEKEGYNFYVFSSEQEVYSLEFFNLCRNVMNSVKKYITNLIPHVNKAHSQYDIQTLKNLLIEKEKHENSYFRVILQLDYFRALVLKNISLSDEQFAKLLRDKLPLISQSAYMESLDKYFVLADPQCNYYCGEVPIRTVREARAKSPLDKKLIEADPFRHRHFKNLASLYGKYSDENYIKLEALKFKVFSDLMEQNVSAIEEDLQKFYLQLNMLEYLDSAKFDSDTAMKEVVKRTIKAQSLDLETNNFKDSFATEEEFQQHKFTMERYFWKYLLMLFEAGFRLLNLNFYEGKQDLNQDLTLVLTNHSHVKRHLEVLEVMLRDLVSFVIPKEDNYSAFKVLEETEEDEEEPLVPGVFGIVKEFIIGPYIMSLRVSRVFHKMLPKTEEEKEQTFVEEIKTTIGLFEEQLKQVHKKLKKFLESQITRSYVGDKWRRDLESESFKKYSSLIAPHILEFTVNEAALNHQADVKALISLVNTLSSLITKNLQ